ncbi:MAG TPA: hypothetical protein VF544_23100 [Pyrinomonadaceae bacterium]|jgi:hypothetical protein
MKTVRIRNIFGAGLLALSLFGIVPMSSTTAQAQWPNYPYGQDRRDERYRERERRRIERERRQAERQRARQYGYDNYGYGNRTYGNYGYGNGSYDGYSNYGGSYQYRQTALNAGYNEGVKAGRRDRQSGRGYEFRDEGAYQSADKDYNSRYGDREIYRQYFREAFQNGYADGYRGY